MLDIKTLPDKPGIYQFLDKENTIIYIGKAISLKKRVASYFKQTDKQSGKIRVLVSKIISIDYIVVDTETDALLLENNLVKKYQPKYNVLLKDDKTFPWICIKNEPFPRIFPTRTVLKDKSSYYGPYTSGKMMNVLLDLIRKLYPLRTCKHNLSTENIKKKKYKVCLDYHLGNCLGACEGKQEEEDYLKNINLIQHIIKGNIKTIERELIVLMDKYAQNYEFEKAQIVKEKLESLSKYQSKSIVANTSIIDVDVFSIKNEQNEACVNYMKIINGALVRSHTITLKKKLEESDEELLSIAIINLLERFSEKTKELVIPFQISLNIPGIKVTIPKKGDKKALLELSERNLKFFLMEKEKRKNLLDPERHSNRILLKMKSDLRLEELPNHIECFDNSNLQGSFAVAAVVVFKKAKPSRKEYRHFNIKTVVGPDDYASMKEIIFRRYSRLLKEEKPLPQLIVVDGGKGQLSSALEVLDQLNLREKICIIGIAKRLEEIYYPDDPIPLYLDKKSETLKVIQHLRDEAHRFGITHHRNKRDKDLTKTELTKINGVGDVLAQKLLTHFGSVKQIKTKTVEELQEVAGKSKGYTVFSYFHKKPIS